MRITRTVVCLLFVVLALGAADVTGKWSGTAVVQLPEGETRNYPLKAQLTQKGEEVTGTFEREGGEQSVIQKGRIQGTKLTFEITPQEMWDPVMFELEVGTDHMEGALKGKTDDGTISGKVTMTRGPKPEH